MWRWFFSFRRKKKKNHNRRFERFFPLLICLFQTHSKPRKDFLLSMPQKKQFKIPLFSTAKLVKQLRLRMKKKYIYIWNLLIIHWSLNCLTHLAKSITPTRKLNRILTYKHKGSRNARPLQQIQRHCITKQNPKANITTCDLWKSSQLKRVTSSFSHLEIFNFIFVIRVNLLHP